MGGNFQQFIFQTPLNFPYKLLTLSTFTLKTRKTNESTKHQSYFVNPLILVKRVASDNTPVSALLLKYNTRSSYRPSPLSESADLDKLSKFPLISASNNSALFVPPCLFQSWESERGKFGHSSPRDASSLFPQARPFPRFHPHSYILKVLQRSHGRQKKCTRKVKHSGERELLQDGHIEAVWSELLVGWWWLPKIN